MLVSLTFLFSGCANIAAKRGINQLEETCNKLLGCSEEQVIIQLGVPKSIQEIGELKSFKFKQSFGLRTNAYGAWESYDDVEIIFKEGRAISWKGYVQR